MREHLFKVCPEWKGQQKIPWAEVLKETGRGKYRFTTSLPMGAQGAGRGEEGRGGGAGCREGTTTVPTHALVHGIRSEDWGAGSFFLCSFFVRTPLLCDFLGAHCIFLGQAWRRAKGSLQRAASREQQTGNLDKKCAAIV